MARKSQEKFAKRKREIERKRKADEKMARRHDKKRPRTGEDDPGEVDRSHPLQPPFPGQMPDGHSPMDVARDGSGIMPGTEDLRSDQGGGEDQSNKP